MDPDPIHRDPPSRPDLIVRHTAAMVVVTNRRREIEWVNPAFTRVTGWTLEECAGATRASSCTARAPARWPACACASCCNAARR